MFERPKIKTYKKGEQYKYCHLKRDGIMITLSHDRALTRHPDGAHDVFDQIRPMPEVYNLSRLNHEVTLFCELFAPGHPASQVKSFLADKKLLNLSIECFAIPSWHAEHSLETLRDFCRDHLNYFPFADFQVIDETPEDHVMAWEASKIRDCEGFVFKDGNLLNWAKWKPVLTTDLVILGFKDGRGKYLGTLGALELGLADGTHVCSCSGMSDRIRDIVSESEDSYLGTVVEVEYQRRDSGGGLRHPRFKRFREDKSREECTEI